MSSEVNNRTIFPYRAVVYINVTFPDGKSVGGTGAVIGRNDILTAAHIVYSPDNGGWATSIKILPGADFNSKTNVLEDQPYELDNFSFRFEAWTSQAFSSGSNQNMTFAESSYDIAVIGISDPLGDRVGYFGYAAGYDAPQWATAIGYPQEGTGMMMAQTWVSNEPGYDVYSSYANNGGDLMGPGSSGGPLFVGSGDEKYIIGVKSSGTEGVSNHWANIGHLFNGIQSAVKENDTMIVVAPPEIELRAKNASQYEGNGGYKTFTFIAKCAGDLPNFCRATWSVKHGSTSSDDFDPASLTGRVFFTAAVSQAEISVRVKSDSDVESDETFSISFDYADGASISQFFASANAVIFNDDLDDYKADTTTSGLTSIGSKTQGNLESGNDIDWFKIYLTPGAFRIAALGQTTNDGTLIDPKVSLMDGQGAVLATDDDGGIGLNALLEYGVRNAGTYYLSVASADNRSGTYKVNVTSMNSPEPVYRFAALSNGAYFYTGNEVEKSLILQHYPSMRFEGIGFYGDVAPSEGLQPVYRFANLKNGGYFYTAVEAEKQTILSNYTHLRFEGASFFVPTAASEITTPVFRLANLINGAYLYTTSAAEKSSAMATGRFRDEGTAFQAWANAQSVHKAEWRDSDVPVGLENVDSTLGIDFSVQNTHVDQAYDWLW